MINESEIANMPEGFHGKFRTIVNGKLCTWFIQNLIEATNHLQVLDYPIKELEQYLDVNTWFHGDKEPSPLKIIEHWRRMETANLEHPIIISKDHGVMDGVHRLMKAYYFNHQTIRAVVFQRCPAPDHIAE